jgi:isopentenyldiphosphate isomerase
MTSCPETRKLKYKAMEEWVDVLDSEGRPLGQRILKSEAHKEGLFHPTVHIWFYTDKLEILLQRRAATKKTFPMYWDVSVAGHVAAGEGIMEAAVREVEEEIGIGISEKDLFPIGVFKSVHKHPGDILDCEFHHTFICRLKTPLASLKKQEEEVADLQLISLAKWEQDIFAKIPSISYVPHKELYYREVISAIKRHL